MESQKEYQSYHESHKTILFHAIKNNHCFLRKFNGVTFSAEPLNLMKINNPKYTSLNGKGIGVKTDQFKLRLLKQTKKTNMPANSIQKIRINRDVSKSLPKVAKVLSDYRPDLVVDAISVLDRHRKL